MFAAAAQRAAANERIALMGMRRQQRRAELAVQLAESRAAEQALAAAPEPLKCVRAHHIQPGRRGRLGRKGKGNWCGRARMTDGFHGSVQVHEKVCMAINGWLCAWVSGWAGRWREGWVDG
eukprot:359959-Chlamydomonas_euryale.AAC.4